MVIGICDDEVYYHDAIRRFAEEWKLREHYDFSLDVKAYETAEALFGDWEAGVHFDLLFLDIKLQFQSGLHLALEIRKVDPYVPIVFITNYAQYAADGYEAAAFRFLVKPLRAEQLNPCFDRALSLLLPKDQPDLYVVQNGVHVRLLLREVMSIDCGRHQALITLRENPNPYSIRFKGSFESFLETVQAPFLIRCHKSHVFNAMYVKTMTRTEIHLMNGKRIPVSRAYAKDVADHLHNSSNGGLLP